MRGASFILYPWRAGHLKDGRWAVADAKPTLPGLPHGVTRMKRKIMVHPKTFLLAITAATGLYAADALAAPPGGWGNDGPGHGNGYGHERGYDQRGPDRGPSHAMVPEGWNRGHWAHDWWDGRYGWWWVLGGARYFYAEPVYPYPSAVVPPGMVAVPAPQTAYYCGNPAGYYPQVAQCFVAWQLVSVAAPVVAQPPPVMVAPPVSAPVYAQPAPAVSTSTPKTTGGTILGAVGGGVAGAQFGQGSGKVAAAILGTVLGAFVGHEVGESLDRADALAAQQAAQQAYVAPVGQTIAWNAPSTSHSGTITPTREGRDAQNNACREFKQTVVIDGKQTEVTSTACQKADGTWVQIGS